MKTKEIRPLGLYVHIPFCVRKCFYCDFLSAPASPSIRKAYLESLCRQAEIFAEAIHLAGERKGFSYQTDSIFIGGGTPSLLTAEQMEQLMQTLGRVFEITADAEITAECNPGTLDDDRLGAFRRAGINRLSLGLQSADNRELKLLGRIHTWEEFLESYRAARQAGFDNINVDLMGALPGQSVENYVSSVNKVLALRPEHISAYSLIIEEGTPFYERYAGQPGGQSSHCDLLPSEEDTVAMDEETWRRLREAGYDHYEISNYAIPGRQCRHNLKYWHCGEYLGLGTGAASYIRRDCGLPGTSSGSTDTGGFIRLKNISDTERFISQSWRESSEDGEVCFYDERQLLSRQEEMSEMAFLGLRTREGVRLKEFEARFGQKFSAVFGDVVERYCSMGLMRQDKEHVALTASGMEVSNRIMADFL